MESFISELEQEARCSLCNDRFSEPKLLKCFHTFCKACIKRHSQLNEEGNTFKCPECCTETSFPELKNVDELNPSVLHTRILKVLAFVESEKVCSVSESHSSASWYCFDCRCSLCDDCHSYHSLFTKTDYNHEVVSLSNFMIEDLEFILAREDNCKLHVGYKLDFFCQDCNANVCLVCQSRDHCQHKTVLSVHSTTARAALDDQLKRLCIREQEMSSRVKVLEDVAAKTREKGEKAVQEVKEKAKEIIERVQQKERELIQEIQEKIEKSDKRKKTGQCILDQAKSTQRYISQVIEKNLPSSQTRGLRDAGASVANYTDLSVQDDSNMAFVVSKQYSRLLNADFGTLVIHKPNDTSYDVYNKEPFNPLIELLIDKECQEGAHVEIDNPEIEAFKEYACSKSSAQEIFHCNDGYGTYGSIRKESRDKDSVYITHDIEETAHDDMKNCVRRKDPQAIQTVESLTKDSTRPKYYETKPETVDIFKVDENEHSVKKARKKRVLKG